MFARRSRFRLLVFSYAIISLSLRRVFGPLNCEQRQTRTSKIMCILPRPGVWLQNLVVKKSRFAVKEISDHPSVLRFPLREPAKPGSALSPRERSEAGYSAGPASAGCRARAGSIRSIRRGR